MKFTEKQLKELATEDNWLKRCQMTTGKMVDNEKWKKVRAKSNKKIVVDEATDTGIVYKDELTTMGKSN